MNESYFHSTSVKVMSRDGDPRPRRPYRPPTGLPPRERSLGSIRGALLSLTIHVMLVILALLPVLLVRTDVPLLREGAGGDGPAGGGGGGSRGRGGARATEGLRFIEVAPAPPAPAVPMPVLPAQQLPPPVVTPPVTPQPVPPVTPPAAASEVTPVPTGPPSATGGVGSGTDGSAGDGPGSGGGVGSGLGTGTGSGNGPGTGGGNASVYMPFPIEIVLPPTPVPRQLRGVAVTAVFDVDSTGRVMSFEFAKTRDRGYNKKLEETLENVRFRPAVRPDGRPVRAKYPMCLALTGTGCPATE